MASSRSKAAATAICLLLGTAAASAARVAGSRPQADVAGGKGPWFCHDLDCPKYKVTVRLWIGTLHAHAGPTLCQPLLLRAARTQSSTPPH